MGGSTSLEKRSCVPLPGRAAWAAVAMCGGKVRPPPALPPKSSFSSSSSTGNQQHQQQTRPIPEGRDIPPLDEAIIAMCLPWFIAFVDNISHVHIIPCPFVPAALATGKCIARPGQCLDSIQPLYQTTKKPLDLMNTEGDNGQVYVLNAPHHDRSDSDLTSHLRTRPKLYVVGHTCHTVLDALCPTEDIINFQSLGLLRNSVGGSYLSVPDSGAAFLFIPPKVTGSISSRTWCTLRSTRLSTFKGEVLGHFYDDIMHGLEDPIAFSNPRSGYSDCFIFHKKGLHRFHGDTRTVSPICTFSKPVEGSWWGVTVMRNRHAVREDESQWLCVLKTADDNGYHPALDSVSFEFLSLSQALEKEKHNDESALQTLSLPSPPKGIKGISTMPDQKTMLAYSDEAVHFLHVHFGTPHSPLPEVPRYIEVLGTVRMQTPDPTEMTNDFRSEKSPSLCATYSLCGIAAFAAPEPM